MTDAGSTLDEGQYEQQQKNAAVDKRSDSSGEKVSLPLPHTIDKPPQVRKWRQSVWKKTKLKISRFFGRYIFTSLTQRIIFLNMAALFILLSGILFLNQFRDSLIEARVESLLTQGEIIAGAIASQATLETDSITIDPERLLELQAGETTFPVENDNVGIDFPINPEIVAPVLRRLISPTRTRARIFDRDGINILDSDRLYSRGQILRYDLPPLTQKEKNWFSQTWLRFRTWFWQNDLPLYTETPDGNGTSYDEVVTALTGAPSSKTRRTKDGDTIVSVAVPVQRFRAVLGVLLLSTEAGAIDKIIEKERLAIVRVFGVAATVSALLSILLASTIARPLRRLSAAAERVRLGVKSREQIPDFSDRRDEIGHLSTSLRDMTNSLYGRIEAIESFAADVSHELKNPLTSLRSAVETLPLVKTADQRTRLMNVIQHDVRRLDRLISDISDASRLDAELARDDAENVDLTTLLQAYHDNYKNMSDNTSRITPHLNLKISKPPVVAGRKKRIDQQFTVSGHKGRLGQVLANLIENARSFVPDDGGQIDLELQRVGNTVQLSVSDNGPGIPAENTNRIFERFYTDRPGTDSFGQNSGLGLSITQQIVEAHGGKITASNITDAGKTGAIFRVSLPAILT